MTPNQYMYFDAIVALGGDVEAVVSAVAIQTYLLKTSDTVISDRGIRKNVERLSDALERAWEEGDSMGYYEIQHVAGRSGGYRLKLRDIKKERS